MPDILLAEAVIIHEGTEHPMRCQILDWIVFLIILLNQVTEEV